MSQDSHCSTNSLELLSQETHDILRALIEEKGSQENPEFKYKLHPFDIQLSDENDTENLEINIERLYSFPMQYKQEALDFNSVTDSLSHPITTNAHNGVITHTTPSNYSTPPNAHIEPKKQVQAKPLPFTCINAPAETIYPQKCLVPANTNFPGDYQFNIGFEEEKVAPVKSAQWTYSHQLEKLFIKMKCLVPIRFIFKKRPPFGSYIKCVVVYQKPEFYREVVERCLNHITKQNDGHHAPKHLLRCENTSTSYEIDLMTGRNSITIPVRDAVAGEDYFTEMFQFMCFNSCPGGLNRRAIFVIFSLELNGQVLGRKVLTPRICACPGRDRGNEEMKGNVTDVVSSQQPSPSSWHETPPPTPVEETKPIIEVDENKDNIKVSGKRSATKITEGFELQSLSGFKKMKGEQDEVFTIQVCGREKYQILLKIKESFDLMDMVPQSFIDNYRAGCSSCGPNWFLEKMKQKESAKDSPEVSNSQNSDSDESPPSTFNLSQLSRTSSGTSSQGSNHSNTTEYSTVRFTLKRTMSLEKKGIKK